MAGNEELLRNIAQELAGVPVVGKSHDLYVTLGEDQSVKIERRPAPLHDCFPNRLGPFKAVPCSLPHPVCKNNNGVFTYHVKFTDATFFLERVDGLQKYGFYTPPCEVTVRRKRAQKKAKFPEGTHLFSWVYPLVGAEKLAEDTKAALLKFNPWVEVWLYGGFVYFNEQGNVLGVNALRGSDSGFEFADPQPWQHKHTAKLWKSFRFQPITAHALREQGARFFCWIAPNEKLEAEGEGDGQDEGEEGEGEQDWGLGAFVFLFSEDPDVADPRNRYFVLEDVDGQSGGAVFAFRQQRTPPEQLCVVCQENRRCMMASGCSHLATCKACTKGDKCFVCGEPAQTFVEIAPPRQ